MAKFLNPGDRMESIVNDPNALDLVSNSGVSNYSLDVATGNDPLAFINDAQSLLDTSNADYDRLYDLVMSAASEQNKAAQASADRAMEFSASEAALNRAWQAEQNQKAMDFSDRMSSTAYQRAMEDMSAAGLNPKLAGRLGSASTPSGVSSSGSSGQGFTSPSMAQAAISVLGSLTETFLTNANKLDSIEMDHYYQMERDLKKAMYKLIPSLSLSASI